MAWQFGFCRHDNRNRTVAEVRHVLSRSGGNMAEAGAVSWQFKRVPSSVLSWQK